MTTDTTDTDESEHTIRADTPTGIARCAELDSQSAPYTVHGVAIGEADTTYGQNGPKFWPAEELRIAVQSLVGVPLNKNHVDDDVDAVIGEVVDAAYQDGVGIVFEAEVDDEEIATKIYRGRLEVSIHAIHRTNGMTEDGAAIVEDVRFLDLSVVPRGGSPSNYVEAGSSPIEALASLTADDVAQLIHTDSDEPDYETTNMTEDTEETTEEVESDVDESELSEEATEDVEEEAEAAEADAESVDDVEDAELEGEEESAEENAELRERNEALEAEVEELRNELESVRLEYAGRLAEDTEFFEATELAEKYSFDELKAKFEEAEASHVPESPGQEESTPAPQTGGADESELSTPDDVEVGIAELESKIEQYDKMGWDAAKADAEERLADLQQ
ncbi:hypothetical protein OB919_20055 [Halobacteria archaeon AArc-curdl1]|uniref:Uncharacterized protein n=1 Tax=Natronosalvus hydrolyticus TaxID=2979988 RepID=A0AAP2ZD03_9EURY|nr:hypothetical protein [Halobacteria archaeon AArc-curdl1]